VAEAALMMNIATSFYSPNTKTMFIMAEALGLKDKYTQAHGRRVAIYAKRLAERIGLPYGEMRLIAMGGLLHDVGKLALSDRIFSNRKEALSEDMLVEVRNHPLIGANLLRRANCSDDICDTVLYHHERLDGSGYPYGLKGEDIPLSARIVSVADCFDAITTDRPYQHSKSCEEAFDSLNRMAGDCLSADLVAAFIDDIQRHGMARTQGVDSSIPSVISLYPR
jgi:putative nucleotidyltransferase with HDIG domain